MTKIQCEISKSKLKKSNEFSFKNTAKNTAKNIAKNTLKLTEKNTSKKALYLDTLAQLQPQKSNELVYSRLQNVKKEELSTKKSLKKRAKSKYITNAFLYKLIDLNSPLKKSYWNTFHCSSVLIQNSKKITSTFCNNRWCITCNRIRTAKLINGYKPEFEKLDNPYFVTLTIPNVNGVDLSNTIDSMLMNFRRITNYIGKRSRLGKMAKLSAIRKLEVTYNDVNDSYHPHFHIIVNGKENAEYIRKQWLAMYTDARIWAQDIRKADINSMIELFKYTTKIITKTKQQGVSIHVHALDIIFQALRKRRTFQTYGIRMVNEDIDELQSQEYTDIEEYESVIYEYVGHDWYNTETGEELTGYVPGEFEEEIKKSIK